MRDTLDDLPLVGGGQGRLPADVTTSSLVCAVAIVLAAVLMTCAVVRAWGRASAPRPDRQTRAVSVHVEEGSR